MVAAGMLVLRQTMMMWAPRISGVKSVASSAKKYFNRAALPMMACSTVMSLRLAGDGRQSTTAMGLRPADLGFGIGRVYPCARLVSTDRKFMLPATAT